MEKFGATTAYVTAGMIILVCILAIILLFAFPGGTGVLH